MKREYRIKQVDIPFKDDKLVAFYPQVKSFDISYIGIFWWKRREIREYWSPFYRVYDKIFPFPCSNGLEICCDTLERAKDAIKEYEGQEDKEEKEDHKKRGSSIDDEQFVKIHEITN